MISETIQCPHCAYTTTITGNPGDKVILTCSKCHTKGVFTFPQDVGVSRVSLGHPAIAVDNLTKYYDKVKAVESVGFQVRKGEVFGFLGPNGAGKTTTIKSILGLIRVASGTISINGFDIHKHEKDAKKCVGYLPEKVAFYDSLTAMQNMRFYAAFKKSSKQECAALIDEFGLSDAVNKKVGKFSKGMIQRLGMARAVLGSPPVLILDEPSGGLDPRGVVLIRDKIKQMRQKGTTIFVSSHILSEIQAVCDRVGIISKGVLVAQDTVAGLSRRLNLKPQISVELASLSDKVIDAVKKVKGIDKVGTSENTIEVICDPQTKVQVILAIATAGGNIVNLQTKEPSLEEVFMRYTEE